MFLNFPPKFIPSVVWWSLSSNWVRIWLHTEIQFTKLSESAFVWWGCHCCHFDCEKKSQLLFFWLQTWIWCLTDPSTIKKTGLVNTWIMTILNIIVCKLSWYMSRLGGKGNMLLNKSFQYKLTKYKTCYAFFVCAQNRRIIIHLCLC